MIKVLFPASPGTAVWHSHVSCHWWSGSRAQHLVLHFPSSGSCRERGFHLAYFSPDWKTQAPSQPLLIGCAFQNLYQLCCSPPDTFKYHNIYIGDPELQAILRVRPHQYKVQWENNLFYYAAANCPMLQTI